jgi:hypothetical protein
VAVKACHGVGKTFIASRIVLGFGSSFFPSKIVTTAPTGRLVKELLWSELRDGHAASKYPLGGEMLTTKWELGPNWYALGFSPQKAAGDQTPTNFQGFHSEHVLVVFDEATGIPGSLWEQAEGILTNNYVRWLAIGNPTDPTSDFEKCFRSRLWKKLTINCFDSPNLTANGFLTLDDLLKEQEILDSLSEDEQEHRRSNYKSVSKAIVSAKWVMERLITWGVEHPLFISKVLGEFPEESEDQVFKLADIIKSQEKEISEKPTRRAMGIDPARKGKDSTIVAVFEGLKQTDRFEMKGKEVTEIAGFVTNYFHNKKPTDEECIAIDSTGLGAGVFDILKENNLRGSLRAIPIEIHFGGAASLEFERPDIRKQKEERCFNMKSRLFYDLREDLKFIKLLDHPIYQEELPTIQGWYDSKGRLRIESKDEYRARTGRKSPDDSDALGLANFARNIYLPQTNRQIRIWRA